MIQIAVFGLSGSGLVLSAYFALVAVGAINSENAQIPRLCRMDGQSCKVLLRTADANVFGVPNVLVGLLYYSGLIVLAFGPDALDDLMGFLVVVGAFTVVLGFYLTIRLLVVHRVRCKICLAAHFINLLLFVTFLAGV